MSLATLRDSTTFALIFSLSACIRATVPPAPARRELPVNGTAKKVILISFDGTSGELTETLLSQRALSSAGIAKMKAEGTHVRRVVPVNPTLTAPAHISIITGATPEVTGIVSNNFHRPGDPPSKTISGFDAEIEAETLWEAARAEGKRVGIITFPGADGRGPRRTADWGLTFSLPLSPGAIVTIPREKFIADWRPPGWKSRDDSFSPVLHAPLPFAARIEATEIRQDIDLLLYDTTNDTIDNYDRLEIRYDDERVDVDSRGWFALPRKVTVGERAVDCGSWSKILAHDRAAPSVRLYRGPVSCNQGYPAAYLEHISSRVGFWPGEPDDSLLEFMAGGDGIDFETFTEQLERLANFLARATAESMRSFEYDLLLAYQPLVDEAEHVLRLIEPRQSLYSETNALKAREALVQSYRLFDRLVAELIDRAGDETAVVVTGDHGLAPVDTTLYLNQLLSDWGFVTVRDRKISNETKWAAYTSSKLAHIVRFGPASELERDDIISRLRALRSPDGEFVFERVAKKQSSDHRNAGDIIAYTFPRFTLSGSLLGKTFDKARAPGGHGGLNHHDAFSTILFARGPGVPKTTIDSIEQTAIARYVATLLGIRAPRNAQ